MSLKLKKAMVVWMALLMLFYCAGFTAEGPVKAKEQNSHPVQTEATEEESGGQKEAEVTPPLTPEEEGVLETNGIQPTEDTGSVDASGNYILGETASGGTVTCSTSLRTLVSRSFGDEPYYKKFQRAAGWDDGVIYSSDFASPDGTDIITTTTPIIRISDNGVDQIAYCADPSLNIPSEVVGPNGLVTYNRESWNVQNWRIRNVMWHGFHDGQNGEYYVQTWAAIRVIAGIGAYTNYYMTDPTVANLVNTLSYQNPNNWDASWSIVPEREEAIWNAGTKRQETGWFQTYCNNIADHGTYTVTLPSGVHALLRNTSGQVYSDVTDQFTVYDDDDFMLYASGSYQGEVTANIIPTTIKRHSSDVGIPDACVIYAPDVPDTQRLFVSLAVGQSPLSGSFRANFTGATGDAQLQKTDNRTKEKLAGATFGLYDTKDNLLKQGVTDENGRWEVSDLVFGDYYFMEIAAPKGYELDQTKLPFTIDGIRDVVTVSKTNEPKKSPFNFKKLDAETKQPLKGVTFVLYSCDKNHTHNELQSDKVTTCWTMVQGTRISGSDGAVDFGNLYAGEYQLVETKTVPGYEKPTGQWRVTIDPEASEPVKVSIKGNAPAFSKDNSTLTVMNSKNHKLPFTGGTGDHRTALMLIGIVLILAGAGAALVFKKRNTYKKTNQK
ncbi:LPXTG cell wall anchor domain-containing protein [Eubacterium sp. 1001713B170207_170306_E7]|uniref:LPXTG cell wall anchor domain-containing protein n=1 Tax=Eubacterium sp. 1001713B170207_170306_E7 TaxID=2787097 RepID=UPI001897C654|nr:LPXTG cell wall anchor domain-containing protein [Eubacterium sp. 1001713B170207_170306_E7]